jgi:hypothetical protein
MSAHLQVGRWLKDPLLGIVVVLRNLPLMIVTLGFWDGTDLLAPAWVVVLRKSDGAVVDKIWAGRAAGAGEAELAAVQADLQSLDVQEFLDRRDPGRSSGRTRWRRRKRGLREFTAESVADEAELRVGQVLWWVVTYPFRFLIKAFTRGFDIT